MRASFRQTRVIGLLASEVKSTGWLTVVSPARLRWDLRPPDDVTYWIGPEGIAMRSEGEVVRVPKRAAGRFAAVLSDLLILLGGDLRRLEARYRIETKLRGEHLSLRAQPRTDDVKKHVASLRFEANGLSPALVEIVEPKGDRSLIRFEAVKLNVEVDPKTMRPPT